MCAVASPRSATTHTDLLIRAQDAGIEVHVVHNASIMNAVGACGLQLYSFGATISIPFFTESWRPDSFYDKLCYNAKGGMHTLCLLGAWRRRGASARGAPTPASHSARAYRVPPQTSRCGSPTWRR